jgi:vacuolar protein sorting-associated protein 53
MLVAHRGVKSRTSLEQVATSSEDEAAVVPLVVLPSSTELFYFYAQSLESCAKLATGSDRILLDLAKVHGKWLKIYAGKVTST